MRMISSLYAAVARRCRRASTLDRCSIRFVVTPLVSSDMSKICHDDTILDIRDRMDRPRPFIEHLRWGRSYIDSKIQDFRSCYG